MESKIAVLGSTDFVTPFSALGMDTFEVGDSRDDIIESAREILNNQYGLVILAEQIAPIADEVFSQTKKKARPCVIAVPFTQESTGFAIEELGKSLKMATGINILSS
jgi:vacuolar-type H+-ATPase subunit F/Vma7